MFCKLVPYEDLMKDLKSDGQHRKWNAWLLTRQATEQRLIDSINSKILKMKSPKIFKNSRDRSRKRELMLKQKLREQKVKSEQFHNEWLLHVDQYSILSKVIKVEKTRLKDTKRRILELINLINKKELNRYKALLALKKKEKNAAKR